MHMLINKRQKDIQVITNQKDMRDESRENHN